MNTLRIIDIQSVSLPEEQSLEEWPDIRISPMLAQNVRRILCSRDVCELNKSSGNHFPDIMEGEHVVPLVEFAIRLR